MTEATKINGFEIMSELMPYLLDNPMPMSLKSHFAIPGPILGPESSPSEFSYVIPKEAYEVIGSYIISRLNKNPTKQVGGVVVKAPGIRHLLSYPLSHITENIGTLD